MAQCQGPRAQVVRLFWSSPVFGRSEYSKVPGAQLNLNAAQVITWFVGVTIYCTFFNNNSPPSRQFSCNKILLKKISYSNENAHWTNFWIERPGPPCSVCTFTSGSFHEKIKIFKENIRLDCYLSLKCCRRQCSLLPFTWAKSQNLTPKCKILSMFWT